MPPVPVAVAVPASASPPAVLPVVGAMPSLGAGSVVPDSVTGSEVCCVVVVGAELLATSVEPALVGAGLLVTGAELLLVTGALLLVVVGALLVTGDGVAVVGGAVVGAPLAGASLVTSAVVGAVVGELSAVWLVVPVVDAAVEPDRLAGDEPAELSRD
jgi:hypothetical protein